MPRKPRFYLPGIPAHIIQRGNNRQAIFFAEDDYLAYLRWLKEGAKQHGCRLHAYVLMTNHVHLLMTPHEKGSISRAIQYVGRRYVTYVNARYGRSGTLWEGRHKGCLVADDQYLLTCMRYIELNPVRAGMVTRPVDYRWSSYQSNASGEMEQGLDPHRLYLGLGGSSLERAHAYRELFRSSLDPEEVHALRATAQTGTPLGNDRFRAEVESMLARSVGQPRRGRPAKRVEKDTDPF